MTMKVKIFHSRRIDALEEAVNAFLESHEVSIQHTQFTTAYAEDDATHLMFHTLILFYWPRVDEDRDPFEEEQVETVTGECAACERISIISTQSHMCEGCTIAAQMGEDQ